MLRKRAESIEGHEPSAWETARRCSAPGARRYSRIMGCILAARAAACCIMAAALLPGNTAAQTWNDERTLALVERASQRRAQQLADTGLVDYRARARGYLTFLAQLGEGFPEPPKIVKADELALEVYWRAPNLSKQRIVGRRDTLLLPTDINYHRDHLGIVQNNFPDIIRLGDGDEVSDVPHPLSARGAGEYDFAITDSLAIRLATRSVEAYRVSVRPRNDREARVIGAAFIDRATGEVLRMAFSFTRAAFLDTQLENISIVLENVLIEGRFWLPSRQEIEIVRTGAWLDYPARGIIRGRWEISDYVVNQGIPVGVFRGPEIVQADPAQLRRQVWTGRILDSLPADVRASSDETVRAVQEEARRLVRAEALARVKRTTLSARAISDFVRYNRVEGLALGGGLARRVGGGVGFFARGRWGIDDAEAKGRGTISFSRASGAGVELAVYRDFRDAGDLQEVSLVRNSLAAQEFGSDYSDPFDVRGASIMLRLGSRLGAAWSASGAVERHGALAIHATPARGRFDPTVPALAADVVEGVVRAERPVVPGVVGLWMGGSVELRGATLEPRDGAAAALRVGRVAAELRAERPVGAHRLVLHSTVAAVSAEGNDVPPQYLVYLGGPVSAPGYAFHGLAGQVGAGQRIEWRAPVPFPAIRLGRFGTAPRSATLAPFVHGAYLGDAVDVRGSLAGWRPSVGIGALMLFEILRVDVARGLRDGRWTFSLDVSRDFWRVM